MSSEHIAAKYPIYMEMHLISQANASNLKFHQSIEFWQKIWNILLVKFPSVGYAHPCVYIGRRSKVSFESSASTVLNDINFFKVSLANNDFKYVWYAGMIRRYDQSVWLKMADKILRDYSEFWELNSPQHAEGILYLASHCTEELSLTIQIRQKNSFAVFRYLVIRLL